ncbi:MAG TPA: lipopolysaccharide biosynthesis protein [Vicinamibacterales bacterium]|nr:lipopolysaccharide biosynthesis protein [Vicinamibacterales bacterium]
MKRHGSKGYGKTAKIGAAWGVFREAVKLVIFLPGAMLLARMLSPEDFGISAAAVLVITLANRLGTLGLNSALVRLKTIRSDHLSTVFTYNLAVGAAAFAALQFAAPSIARFYRRPEVGDAIAVAAVSFLFVPFGSINTAIFQREMRFKETAISEWVFAVIFPLVAVALAWSGFGFWSTVYGQLAARLSQVAVQVYQGRCWPRLHFSLPAFREVAPFGAGVAANRLLVFSTENVDSIIVGRLFGIAALGYYDKAFNTMSKLSEKLVVDPGVTFRIFSIIQDDAPRFHRAYRKVILSSALVGLPFFFALIVMAPELLQVMYGPQWAPSILPFQLLCIVGALRVANGYSSAAIMAAGYAWARVGRSFLRIVVLVVAIFALQSWGIVGAATAVLVASLSSTVMTQTLLNRLVGLRWRQLAGPVLPGLVCTAILVPALVGTEFVVTSWLSAPSALILLAAKALTAVAVFVGFVVSFRIAGMAAVVEEVLADLAPPLQRFYVRVHRKLRGMEPVADAQRGVA